MRSVRSRSQLRELNALLRQCRNRLRELQDELLKPCAVTTRHGCHSKRGRYPVIAKPKGL